MYHNWVYKSGLGLLIYQGAEAFDIWTDKKVPVNKGFEAVSGKPSKNER